MANYEIKIEDGDDVVVTSGKTKITIKTEPEVVKEDQKSSDQLLLG